MADALVASLDVPKLGEFLLDNAGRAHNRVGKESLRLTLLDHAEKTIPGHFERAAHRKYRYADRSPAYRAIKQRKYGSSLDLVMTGRTEQEMTSERDISVGGTAVAGTLKGVLKLRFAFGRAAQQAHARRATGQSKAAPMRSRTRKDGKPRVDIAQMRREVAAITPDEAAKISEQVRDRYVEGVKTSTGPRQRVKI